MTAIKFYDLGLSEEKLEELIVDHLRKGWDYEDILDSGNWFGDTDNITGNVTPPKAKFVWDARFCINFFRRRKLKFGEDLQLEGYRALNFLNILYNYYGQCYIGIESKKLYEGDIEYTSGPEPLASKRNLSKLARKK